jgi:hypothetical protein
MPYFPKIAFAGQGGFECKTSTFGYAFVDFLEHKSASFNGCGLRIEWRQASSD